MGLRYDINRLISHGDFRQLEEELLQYHLDLTEEACIRYKMPKLADVKYVAIRKRALLGFYGNALSDWERVLLNRYRKNHMWEEYYPLIQEITREFTLPQVEKAYGCKISYHHLFEPFYHENMVYSFSVTYFQEALFKKHEVHFSPIEEEIAAMFSTFFREQNKRGPEQVTATILGEKFLSIIAGGVLTPFYLRYAQISPEAEGMYRKMFDYIVKDAVTLILQKYFSSEIGGLFIYLDIEQDCLLILCSLKKGGWEAFLDSFCV